MLTYIIAEKYYYNKPFDQIVSQLGNQGFAISKSTLGDNIHRVIGWMRRHMTSAWEAAIRKARYWQLDETPLLVGCGGLMAKALKYALAEWPAIKRILENAFLFSLIESCKLNGLAPEKYIAFLLRQLKEADFNTDKSALLPCYCMV